MHFYKKEDIEAKVKEIWNRKSPTDYDHNAPDEIEVSVYPEQKPKKGVSGQEYHVDIKLSSMYESPSLNLGLLMELAEFFGTKNINDDDRFSNGGCDTCDYGSSYGFTLTVRPEKVK